MGRKRQLNADFKHRVGNRTAKLTARDRSIFLVSSGAVLDASLDYAATTAGVARVAVPVLADWCLVDIADEDGVMRAGVAAVDPSKTPPEPRLALRVVQTAESEIHTEREFSALCAPLRARGHILGALTLISTTRQYTKEDAGFVEEFGRRAAMAIDNARLYDQTSRIAEMLQRSLLPDRLPRLEGVTVGARYFPAKQERVGGDWYDVLERPDGTIGIAVGDVSGKGVQAAVMMGKLRSALRAYALEEHSPSAVLERVDRLLRDFDSTQMATVLYLTVDPQSWTVRFSSAGHVPPLLRTPRATATYLGDGRSVPLGVSDRPVFHEAAHVVEPGSTLLLYTDGLIERQGSPLELGLTRLQAAVAEGPQDPDALCDHVVASLLPNGSAADDVALIALFVAPALERPLELRLSAEPSELRTVRSTLARWMGDVEATSDETYDVVVAACEAVTNAIQHAYGPGPASILVRAALEGAAVVVTVRDWGRWYEHAAEGYGLRLMRGLMDAVDVDTQGEGTKIRMTRHLEGARSP
ncbi:MAG TPA: SpoIIE family protein phosphatase [bacterium]|nr:SpoIIE family protein phosphatase [bacterium]